MLNEYTSRYRGRKVGFVGVGISNIPIIKAFCAAGAEVKVRDAKPREKIYGIEKLDGIKAVFYTGPDYLDGIDEELLFLAPAIRPDKPELAAAKARGTVLTTELNEFLALCPCRTVGVTGSDGKTTTTTLIAKILAAGGHTVHLGGNIGVNLFETIDNIKKDDYAVIEFSSFQLMKMTRSPDIAVITNLSPNHLDWHTDMTEYLEAKKNIYRFNPECRLITNIDNAATAAIAAERQAVPVSCTRFTDTGACFYDGWIYRNGRKVVPDKDIILPGIHNRYNYCCAAAATEGLASDTAVASVARSFRGVEHRCELVRTVNGVKYYNSSIDSSPTRTAAACNAFPGTVILIAGGYDKHIPLEPLGDTFCRKVSSCVLMGDTADKIEKVLADAGYRGRIKRADSMEEAVSAAAGMAVPGDTVLLSPAAASFDKFRNFEERGNVFKECVNRLPERR